ncbi:hypothetical protein ACSTI5_00095, partial [Vibrio parahaemolyticus]
QINNPNKLCNKTYKKLLRKKSKKTNSSILTTKIAHLKKNYNKPKKYNKNKNKYKKKQNTIKK